LEGEDLIRSKLLLIKGGLLTLKRFDLILNRNLFHNQSRQFSSGCWVHLFRHNAPDLATTFIPSLQHILVGITLDGLLLRKLESNIFLIDGRAQTGARAWAPAPKHEVWGKLWTARWAQNVIGLLLVLLGGERSKAGGSEGLRLRAGVVGLWLSTVKALLDLPFFVSILPFFNIFSHGTEVGCETVEVTG